MFIVLKILALVNLKITDFFLAFSYIPSFCYHMFFIYDPRLLQNSIMNFHVKFLKFFERNR